MKSLAFAVTIVVSATTACAATENEVDEALPGSEQAATKTVNLGGCGVEVPATVSQVFESSTDSFKDIILRKGPCPQVKGRPITEFRASANTQIPSVMKALAERGCTRIGRNLVSEKGMYRSATTDSVSSDDPTRFKISGLSPRLVEVWQCGNGDGIENKIFIAGPEAAFHIIAFDPTAKAFNFYSTNPGTKNEAFVFHGNSFEQAKESEIQIRQSPFPDHACTTCHTNGGLLLKELRFPWLNWQAVPGVGASELRDAFSMNALTGGGPNRSDLRIVEDLERDVIQSQIIVNNSRIARLKAQQPGGLTATPSNTAPYTLQTLLAPLFCETEVNIATSPTSLELDSARKPKTASTNGIVIPADLVLNRLLVPQGSAISIAGRNKATRLDTTGNDDNQDFGAFSTAMTIQQSTWLSTMREFGIGVPADKTTNIAQRRGGIFGDGIFPMPTAARSFANDDYIARLINQGIIEEKFAADVLMIDFPNPVFSKVRCDLLAAVPNVPANGLSAAQITQRVTAAIQSARGSSAGAAELKANAARTLTEHASAVSTFMTKCQTNLPKKPIDVYVLTAARRAKLYEDVRTPSKNFPTFAVESFVRDQFFPVDVSVPPEMALSRALSRDCTLIVR